MSQDLIRRAALAIRGRFGSDVWEAWANLGIHDQQDWIAAKVPERSPVEMRRALIGILFREGIKRTRSARCCATCERPIFSEV